MSLGLLCVLSLHPSIKNSTYANLDNLALSSHLFYIWATNLVRRRVCKQKAHTLPVMRPTNRLGKRRTNIHDPQSRTHLNLLPQRNRIRNHHPA
jgi:hypothetical protein